MTPQQEQIQAQKADLVLANIQSNGGYLSPQQSNTFFEILMEQPTILPLVRTVQMDGPELKIPKIGIGTRMLRPGVENTALAPSDRTKPDFGLVELKTQEVIAEVRIPYSALEDNIEKGGLEATILRLMGKRAAVDFEEALILSDTASDDPYLAMTDGLLKRIVSREVDVSSFGVVPKAFSAALKALPPRFKRVKSALKFFTTPAAEEDYRLKISERQTALGDATLTGESVLGIQGVKVIPTSYMPNGKGILIDPKNIIVGIQRNFRVESQRLIAERQIQIVLTARWAMNLETEDAAVQLDGLENIEEDEE